GPRARPAPGPGHSPPPYPSWSCLLICWSSWSRPAWRSGTLPACHFWAKDWNRSKSVTPIGGIGLKVDCSLAKMARNGLKCGSFWSCWSFSDSTVLGTFLRPWARLVRLGVVGGHELQQQPGLGRVLDPLGAAGDGAADLPGAVQPGLAGVDRERRG